MKYRLVLYNNYWLIINNHNEERAGMVKKVKQKFLFQSFPEAWITPHDMHKIQLLIFELKERINEGRPTDCIERFRKDILDIIKKENAMINKINKEKRNGRYKGGKGKHV
jgi:septum formation topological specificity factor MinE